MEFLFWILVGMIIGWVIEWVIDWLFWRRHSFGLRERLQQLEADNGQLQARIAELEQQTVAAASQVVPQQVDDLEIIDGIGPAFARRLNQVGIFSFAQLGASTAERIREIIKPEGWQKIEPEQWIAEARALAAPDDLEDIIGIGEVFARRLKKAGIHNFAQLAELSPDKIEEIVKPEQWQKIQPEQWIEEARALAAIKANKATGGADRS